MGHPAGFSGVPQGLKPFSTPEFYGTAEAVPLSEAEARCASDAKAAAERQVHNLFAISYSLIRDP